jgi:hypothetical protein
MHMTRLLARIRAHLYSRQPRIFHDILDLSSLLWVRIKHLSQQRPTAAWGEVADRGRKRGLRRCGAVGSRRNDRLGVAGCDVGLEQRIRGLGDAPGELLEVEAVVDNPAGPDVDEPGVVCWAIGVISLDNT